MFCWNRNRSPKPMLNAMGFDSSVTCLLNLIKNIIMSNHKKIWSNTLKLIMDLPYNFDKLYDKFKPEWADFTYKGIEKDKVYFDKMVNYILLKN